MPSHGFASLHHSQPVDSAPSSSSVATTEGSHLAQPPKLMATERIPEEAAILEASTSSKQPIDKDEQYARYLQDQLDAESDQVDTDAQLALKLSRTHYPHDSLPEGALDGDFDWNAHLYKSKLEYNSLPNHLKHNHHYCDDPDYLYALKLQQDLDKSAMDADQEDTVMEGTSPAAKTGKPLEWKHYFGGSGTSLIEDETIDATDAQDDAVLGGHAIHEKSDAEIARALPPPIIPEVNLLDLQLPGGDNRPMLRDIVCTSCGEKCFRTEADIIKLVRTWHEEKLQRTGYTFACHACDTPICPGCFGAQGCSPETPRGKPTTSSDTDKKLKHRLRSSLRPGFGSLIPSWNCHKAPLQIIWFVLVHFDHQLAKQQINRTSTAKKRTRRRGTGPPGVGYGAELYDDLSDDFDFADDSADDAEFEFPISNALKPSTSAASPTNPMSGAPPSQHYMDLLSVANQSANSKPGPQSANSASKKLKKHYHNFKAQVGLGSSTSDNGPNNHKETSTPDTHKTSTDVQSGNLPSLHQLDLPKPHPPSLFSQSWAKFDESLFMSGYGGHYPPHYSWYTPPAHVGYSSGPVPPTKNNQITANPKWSLNKAPSKQHQIFSKPTKAPSVSTTHHMSKENVKSGTGSVSTIQQPPLLIEEDNNPSLMGATYDPADAINARNSQWNWKPASKPSPSQPFSQNSLPQLYSPQQPLPPSSPLFASTSAYASSPPYSAHAPHYLQPTQSSLAKSTGPNLPPDPLNTHHPILKWGQKLETLVDDKGSMSKGAPKHPALSSHTFMPEIGTSNHAVKQSSASPAVGIATFDDWDDAPQFFTPHPYSYYSRRGMRRGKDKHREAFEEARKKQDDLSRQCFLTLCALLTSEGLKLASAVAGSEGQQQINQAMGQQIANLLMPSTCIDHITELVRGTLQDAQDRTELYDAMLELLRILLMPATAEILVKPRPYKRASLLLHPSPDDAAKYTSDEELPSVRNCMSDLVRQCKVYSQGKVDTGGRKKLGLFCGSFVALSASLDRLNAVDQTPKVPPINLQDHKVWWDAYHKEHAFEEVPDEVMLQNHVFGELAIAPSQAPAKGRMRRLVEEGANLTTSLPPGIFVRYAENRPDIMKALIIGPCGTPYHGGMFEFDLWADPQYPRMPPKCHFKTTGGGRAHLNPNLYNSGKVCLSLLGTWAGEPWRPEQSTILQILVSLQAMVLTSEPWYNEPGRESDYARQQRQSKEYNKDIQRLTVKWAMEDVLKKESEAKEEERKTTWGEVIQHYIANNTVELTKTVNDWARLDKKVVEDAEAFLQRMTAFV